MTTYKPGIQPFAINNLSIFHDSGNKHFLFDTFHGSSMNNIKIENAQGLNEIDIDANKPFTNYFVSICTNNIWIKYPVLSCLSKIIEKKEDNTENEPDLLVKLFILDIQIQVGEAIDK